MHTMCRQCKIKNKKLAIIFFNHVKSDHINGYCVLGFPSIYYPSSDIIFLSWKNDDPMFLRLKKSVP